VRRLRDRLTRSPGPAWGQRRPAPPPVDVTDSAWAGCPTADSKGSCRMVQTLLSRAGHYETNPIARKPWSANGL